MRIEQFATEELGHTIRVVPVKFSEDEDFERDLLPRLLTVENEKDNELSKPHPLITKDDIVYLDTTGGFRDAVSQMMLLSRILRYQGTEIAGGVYAKLGVLDNNTAVYNGSEVYDVSESFHVFDLITGLSEFQSFGSVNLINSYFKERQLPSNAKVDKLLDEMTKLSEYLTLCRSGKIGDQFIAFQNALDDIDDADLSDDPMLSILLALFREKFAHVSTTPDQIIWCAENHLIQQALTLYTDRLQRYIIETSGLILIKNADDKTRINKLRNNPDIQNKSKDDYALILDDFFMESYRQKTVSMVSAKYKIIKDNQLTTIECLPFFRNSSIRYSLLPCISDKEYKNILKTFCYAQILRNQLNHSDGSLGRQKAKSDYLKKQGYKVELGQLSIEEIVEFLVNSMRYLQTVINKAHKED